MCGIVGGVGRIAILPLLLDGLKKTGIPWLRLCRGTRSPK